MSELMTPRERAIKLKQQSCHCNCEGDAYQSGCAVDIDRIEDAIVDAVAAKDAQLAEARKVIEFYAKEARESVQVTEGKNTLSGMKYAVNDRWGNRARAYLAAHPEAEKP